MRPFPKALLILLIFPAESAAQSLGEVARREAERRKTLEKQGIEGKVIGSETLSRIPAANIATFVPPGPTLTRTVREPGGKGTAAVASYRSKLMKLDRDIRQCEDRLAVLQQRNDAERRAMARSGRFTSSKSTGMARESHFWQVQELESKIRRLREERLEAYDAGRKAGFLPGELDGHGIIP